MFFLETCECKSIVGYSKFFFYMENHVKRFALQSSLELNLQSIEVLKINFHLFVVVIGFDRTFYRYIILNRCQMDYHKNLLTTIPCAIFQDKKLNKTNPKVFNCIIELELIWKVEWSHHT